LHFIPHGRPWSEALRSLRSALLFLTFTILAQTADPAKDAQRAQELVVAGRFDEAVRIYRDLVQRTPGNPLLLQNLCIAEYSARQYRDAIGHATAALKLQSDLIPARLLLGGSYLELGEFGNAVAALKPAVEANPRDRNGRLMLGEALLESGQAAAAVEHFQSAAEMLPDNPRVWFGLGRAMEALGKSADAKHAWDRLMALPASLESHLHTAEVHRAEGRWRDAAVEWREALRRSPDKAKIRVGLGEALFRSRDYSAAIDTLKPLLASESAEVQFLYGASLLNLQQPVEAMPYLQAAVARDASLLPARAALGQALLQTGKPEEAIPFLAGAASTDQDGSIHFQLFRAYQLTHREAEARRALAEYQRFRASPGARP
jgi:predicted Zn-dependent protease